MTRLRMTAPLVLAGLLLVPAFARAQDGGGEPDPEEVKKKILEIEKLMKGAEEALARSTDTRSAAERSAEAAKKILDQKAKQETGKSAEDLRKEAESGSQQAKDTLDRLTKAAQKEAEDAAKKMTEILGGNGGGGATGSSGGSSAGIKELIEKLKGDSKGASERMKWLLDQTKPGPGRARPENGGGQEKQPDAKDPSKPDKPKQEDKKPQDTNKKPESKTEPPRNPEFVQWVAELPPTVRRAVESQDWDSIPPKWREMLRDWTKKMAEESEKDTR